MRKAGGTNALNMINKLSLEKTAALIQRSRLFVGCDSGPLHMAAAVGTPTVGIFGPGNREKWRPRGEGHEIVYNDVPCAPCTRFGYTMPVCGGRYQCMTELDTGKLLQSVSAALENV